LCICRRTKNDSCSSRCHEEHFEENGIVQVAIEQDGELSICDAEVARGYLSLLAKRRRFAGTNNIPFPISPEKQDSISYIA
jgi:hypothetical protein